LLLLLKSPSHDLQVTFLYPSRPNQTILKGLNLTLPAKKLTCIMGPSGCGKSTVMSLLLRLYEPLTGKVTLDGVELSKIDPQFLRSIIGLVQQEPVRAVGCAGAGVCAHAFF
jgi:ABC-type multidrug transport system fused ATPase/permease subunit